MLWNTEVVVVESDPKDIGSKDIPNKKEKEVKPEKKKEDKKQKKEEMKKALKMPELISKDQLVDSIKYKVKEDYLVPAVSFDVHTQIIRFVNSTWNGYSDGSVSEEEIISRFVPKM